MLTLLVTLTLTTPTALQQVYEIDIEEYVKNKWVPFELPANQDPIQLDVTMLYAYERVNLLPSNSTTSKGAAASSKSRGTYVTPSGFRLPDVVGVFSLKVFLQRFGYSYLWEKKTISVVPFRHDEFPRFLFGSYPYYAGAWSMIVSFWIFVVVYLYYREESPAVKVTPSSAKDKAQ